MENPRNAERAFKAQFERWSARGADVGFRV
jgi:hypothetical protein